MNDGVEIRGPAYPFLFQQPAHFPPGQPLGHGNAVQHALSIYQMLQHPAGGPAGADQKLPGLKPAPLIRQPRQKLKTVGARDDPLFLKLTGNAGQSGTGLNIHHLVAAGGFRHAVQKAPCLPPRIQAEDKNGRQQEQSAFNKEITPGSCGTHASFRRDSGCERNDSRISAAAS